MEYEQLREQVIKRNKELVPYDIELNCQDLEYQYNTTNQHSLLVDKKKRYKPLILNDWANQQFLTKLGIPGAYIKKCPSDLKEENINYFLSRAEDEWKYRIIRDNEVRAVLTKSFAPIDDSELVNLVEPLLKNKEVQIENIYHNNLMTSIRIVFDETHSKPSNVGDIVKKGIAINNSEVGYLAVQFRALLFRLVCANGLISPRSLGGFHFRHRGNKDRIMSASMVAVDKISKGLDDFSNKFESTRQFSVGDPITYIEREVKKNNWPNKWMGYFEQAFYKEQGTSLFHIINAFTRGAQQLSLHNRIIVEEYAATLVFVV